MQDYKLLFILNWFTNVSTLSACFRVLLASWIFACATYNMLKSKHSIQPVLV